jgi:cob(I)alamin adenosyltransferase
LPIQQQKTLQRQSNMLNIKSHKDNKMERGYIQIYTGDGKGKTTAAIGLALRASGHGMKTYIGQFMKGQYYGELTPLRDNPLIEVEQYGDEGCFRKEEVTPQHIAHAHEGLQRAAQAMASGRYDIVILDEINVAIWFELISEQEVLQLLERRPAHLELVLTGRRAPRSLIEKADLVTEMQEVKHYYTQGVEARDGIER